MHITANCIIITQQFPIENRSEHGRFAEMPLNTTGQVQNLGDYYAIRSTCMRAPRHHSTIQIASTSCSQAQRALLHSLVCLIASFLARSFLLSFDIQNIIHVSHRHHHCQFINSSECALHAGTCGGQSSSGMSSNGWVTVRLYCSAGR